MLKITKYLLNLLYDHKRIMIYGLQRSGTNFIKDAVASNFYISLLNVDNPRNNPSHKHYRPYSQKKFPTDQYITHDDPESLTELECMFEHNPPKWYVVVSKSPYSWLLSYEKWAKRCDWPDCNHHYIEEWNLFYGTWLEWRKSSNNVLLVRYIDMLRDPKGECGRICEKMGLTRRWKSYSGKLTPERVDHSPDFDSSRRRYYLEREYLSQYSTEKWESLRTYLNADVVRGLGYELRDRPKCK